MIPANEIEYWASVGNCVQVRRAIDAGYDVNEQGESLYTALHVAAENGHAEVARLLLDAGANVDARLTTGQTPLDLAVLAEHGDVSQLLRDYASLNHPERAPKNT